MSISVYVYMYIERCTPCPPLAPVSPSSRPPRRAAPSLPAQVACRWPDAIFFRGHAARPHPQ